MNAIALIPARGGSKGLPRKNVLPLGGKPLVAWTIEAARACPELSRVLVSTDDTEISEAARAAGADVPFLRPAEIAGDASPVLDAALHALAWCRAQGDAPEVLVLLQPTSPLRLAEDIRGALAMLAEGGCDAVVSVCEPATHPWLLRTVGADGFMAPLLPVPAGYTPRQAFPSVYALNGAVYAVRVDALERERTFAPARTRPFVMPLERSIDIDTALDLRIAEALLAARS